jgi:hypothetical protein
LLGTSPFPEAAALFVVLLDPFGSTIGRADRAVTTFESASLHGYHVHRFAILGVDMRLFVGAAVPRDFCRTCFSRAKHVAIRPSDSLALEMGKMAVNSPPKGSLAARSVWAEGHDRGRSLRGER